MFKPEDIIPGVRVITAFGEVYVIIKEFEDGTFTLLCPDTWNFAKECESAEFMADHFNDFGFKLYVS